MERLYMSITSTPKLEKSQLFYDWFSQTHSPFPTYRQIKNDDIL